MEYDFEFDDEDSMFSDMEIEETMTPMYCQVYEPPDCQRPKPPPILLKSSFESGKVDLEILGGVSKFEKQDEQEEERVIEIEEELPGKNSDESWWEEIFNVPVPVNTDN